MADEDPLAEMMQMLRAEYLAEAPAKLAELDALLIACEAGDVDAIDGLYRMTHQLTGSSGSYGFSEISALARQMEQRVKPHPEPSAALAAELRELQQQIVVLFQHATP